MAGIVHDSCKLCVKCYLTLNNFAGNYHFPVKEEANINVLAYDLHQCILLISEINLLIKIAVHFASIVVSGALTSQIRVDCTSCLN